MSTFPHNSNRRGFTLVELLVVIAIIATLIGLLIPAVNSAREAARRTGCGFNIRSLAQAVAMYESTRRRLPAATDRLAATSVAGSDAASTARTGYSWLFHVLPYMEEGVIYNNVSANTSKFQFGPFSIGSPPTATVGGAYTGQAGTGIHAAEYVISPLKCPSFSGGDSVNFQQHGETNFSTSEGSLYASFAPNNAAGTAKTAGSALVAISNYKAMAATHMNTAATPQMPATGSFAGLIQLPPEGAVSGSEWLSTRPGVQQSTAADGMSKTVMIVESRERGFGSWIDGTTAWVVAYSPSLTPVEPFLVTGNWRQTNAATGALITQSALSIQPTDTVKYLPVARLPTNRIPTNGIAWGPSSEHQGGTVMHAFGDTHVAQIGQDVDANVYLSICSRGGGEANNLAE